jgi:carbamoyl-phosphate synthase small subunit
MKTFGRDQSAITHINLNEDSLEGLKSDVIRAFAVQYHPEASPGPHDSAYLFNQFAKVIQDAKA